MREISDLNHKFIMGITMDNLKSISDYEVNIYYIDPSGGKHCTRSDKYSSFKDANEQFKKWSRQCGDDSRTEITIEGDGVTLAVRKRMYFDSTDLYQNLLIENTERLSAKDLFHTNGKEPLNKSSLRNIIEVNNVFSIVSMLERQMDTVDVVNVPKELVDSTLNFRNALHIYRSTIGSWLIDYSSDIFED